MLIIGDVEVQLGVFDMVELLIDLIAARLSYSPSTC